MLLDKNIVLNFILSNIWFENNSELPRKIIQVNKSNIIIIIWSIFSIKEGKLNIGNVIQIIKSEINDYKYKTFKIGNATNSELLTEIFFTIF